MSHTPGPLHASLTEHIGGYSIRKAGGQRVGVAWTAEDAQLWASAPELVAALSLLAPWAMRDGTPCYCTAGKDEDEPQGTMPTLHSTACEVARAALARVKIEGRQTP